MKIDSPNGKQKFRVFVYLLLLMVIILSACTMPTPMLADTAIAYPVTSQSTPSPSIGATRISTKDGMVQVYVPAGDFIMGSTDQEIARAVKIYPVSFFENEKPQHSVYLDAYWIDRTAVTNAQYSKCVLAGQCSLPQAAKSRTRDNYYGTVQYADYPVIYVTWKDADNYCAWAGRRLPTEAEWEKAARGTDGRIYPWGDQAPDYLLANFDEIVGDTTEVGKYPAGASPYGALDMAGNVWQWVKDWYAEDYYQNSPKRNPAGPASGSYKVMRGGAFYFDSSVERSANRIGIDPELTWDPNGFRCLTSA